jgi:hypothetical protein
MEPTLLLLVLCTVCGGLSALVAGTKGWNESVWFLIGFLFGPFGLIAAAGMPDRRVRTFLRHLASEKGWAENSESSPAQPKLGDPEDADSQRKRIFGA